MKIAKANPQIDKSLISSLHNMNINTVEELISFYHTENGKNLLSTRLNLAEPTLDAMISKLELYALNSLDFTTVGLLKSIGLSKISQISSKSTKDLFNTLKCKAGVDLSLSYIDEIISEARFLVVKIYGSAA